MSVQYITILKPLLVVGLILSFMTTFFEPLKEIAKGWATHSHGYGVVIFCVSVYMVWSKRVELRRWKVRPNLKLGTSLCTGDLFKMDEEGYLYFIWSGRREWN